MATAIKAQDDLNAELQAELKALRDDIASLAGTVRDLAVDRANAVGKTVTDAASYVGDTLKVSADEARRRGEEMAGEVEAAIARHPMTSVAIALGVGYIIAALSRR